LTSFDESNRLAEQNSSSPKEENLFHVCPRCGLKLPISISNCPDDGTYLTSALGERLSEHYEFLEEIGSGGNGIVYKARHRLLNYIVAIKMLRANKLEQNILRRFNQEAKVISTLDHPAIVKLRDYGVTESGQPHMVLEYLQGQTLAQLIDKQGPLSVKKFINIFLQCCDGLEHAHKQNILHRDVKPTNIMFSGDTNQVKILDFGIAKIVDMADQSAGLTKTGEVFGSPRYMSPEQATGKRVDVRSDIYSLGIVMYEALTGSTPFAGNTTYDLLSSQISTIAPSVRSIEKSLPVDIEAIVSKCLAKEPYERFQSMGEVKKALMSVNLGKRIRKPSTKSDRWKHPETWLLLSGAVLLIAVCALIGAFAMYFMKRADAPHPVQELEGMETLSTNGETARAYIRKNIHNKVINFDKSISASVDVNDVTLEEFDNTNVTEELSMRGSRIQGPGLAHLIHLPLRKLALSTGIFTNRAMKEISHMENLEVLDLSGTNVNDEGLSELAKLRNLNTLYLKEEEKITNAGLANLAPLSKLETLNLSKNSWLTEAGLKAISALPSLRILRLDKSGISDADLSAIKHLKNLSMLTLRYSQIGDKGVEHLVDTQIAQIDLQHSNITDKALESLAKMKALKEVGLHSCKVSEAAMDQLKKLRPDVKVYFKDVVPFNSNHDNQ
jgi:tRNA A-37 threonylcarbamoyl transferase component Bud32/Leucine-rich repeat (LRR) protein